MEIGEREWLARWAKRAGYEILDEVASAGMGIVYKARQISLNRPVALKLIRPMVHRGGKGLANHLIYRIHRGDRPEQPAWHGKAPCAPELSSLQSQVNELARRHPGISAEELARHLRMENVLAGAITRLTDEKAQRWAEDADANATRRFRAEAESMARLQHPHIVQIYDFGEQNGLFWFSMEFVEGGTLAEKLNNKPLSAPETARLIETLARAVHAAHQKGVVHRDLKPANVLITADGTPKITDFGLVKRLDLEPNTLLLEEEGAILGTPVYMAPEQAAGRLEVGPAVDVYQLGAILYECLTGRPPFKAGTSLDTIRQVIDEQSVPPRHLQPKVPRNLETICLKCLQKAPHCRYESAAELVDDLRRFLSRRRILARPTKAQWAVPRPLPGRPWNVAVALITTLLMIAGTVGAVALLTRLLTK
jgi:serine/threonine-protein kinase